MSLVTKTFELYGKTYTLEAGELAKQATGAALVKQAVYNITSQLACKG